jgi:hypothetical protein
MSGRRTAWVLGLGVAALPAMAQENPRPREESASREVSRDASEAAARPAVLTFAPSPSEPRPLFAQETARPRDGGSSDRGSRGSDAGARHHDRGDRSSGSSRSSYRQDRSSSNDSSSPPLTDAQRRHPRAGTGTGTRLGRFYYSDPGYYRSFYGFSPYYRYRSWGYDPYWDFYGYGYYGGYYPYSYGGYRAYRSYRDVGSLRLLVDPSETRVYVDGYYAGIVDDFDGLFQRLHIAPGRHEISFKLEGYRTHTVKVYVPIDDTLKIHHDMVRGSGDETVAELGLERESADLRRSRDRGDSAERELDEPNRRSREGGQGRLGLVIRPDDASVYVDGEFRGSGRRVENLTLPAGRHRIEVVRPGYRTFEREVEVRPGQSEVLTIELEKS